MFCAGMFERSLDMAQRAGTCAECHAPGISLNASIRGREENGRVRRGKRGNRKDTEKREILGP
jgi:hypothetical protein